MKYSNKHTRFLYIKHFYSANYFFNMHNFQVKKKFHSFIKLIKTHIRQKNKWRVVATGRILLQLVLEHHLTSGPSVILSFIRWFIQKLPLFIPSAPTLQQYPTICPLRQSTLNYCGFLIKPKILISRSNCKKQFLQIYNIAFIFLTAVIDIKL